MATLTKNPSEEIGDLPGSFSRVCHYIHGTIPSHSPDSRPFFAASIVVRLGSKRNVGRLSVRRDAPSFQGDSEEGGLDKE